MSRHEQAVSFWARFWGVMGIIGMFLSIMLGSVIIGLAIAWVIIMQSWFGALMIVAMVLLVGVPTALVVAKWPTWVTDRRERLNTIEFDFTGLKPGQEEYYRAILNYTEPDNRGRLLYIHRAMEKAKMTNFVADLS